VDVAEAAPVDAYLPRYTPRQQLDPHDPVSIGSMVGPEAYTEVRYLAHRTMLRALEAIPRLAAEFATVFGRPSASLVSPYRLDGAELVVIGLGSVLGTVQDVIDGLRADGAPVGALGITTFRPFPADAVRAALRPGQRVMVLERAFPAGAGGVVTADVRAALSGVDCPITTVVAGLGGRPVMRESLRRILLEPPVETTTFLDLDTNLVGALS
jgi:pyruvate ferredoxin oxidoreductase alpha subunit